MLNTKNAKSIILAMIAALLVLAVGLAEAALPAIVGTTMTSVQTDGLALVDLVWPVVGAITGGVILLKLFKRGASKI
jgi:hypothetical protein